MILFILSTLTGLLCIATGIRGYMTFQQQHQDAITIEEGLGVIKDRLLSREYIQPVLAVLICGLFSALGAMVFYLWESLMWVPEIIAFAFVATACTTLILPWLRRMPMDRVIQYLERQAVPKTEIKSPPGHLKQLMRTYLYYHKTNTQPALFDWVRRQLSLHILGIDVQAYLPFSIGTVIRRSAKMLLYVALLTGFLFLTREKESAWEGYEISEGEVPTEMAENLKYQGAKQNPEGDPARPTVKPATGEPPEPSDPSRPLANDPAESDIINPEQTNQKSGENNPEMDSNKDQSDQSESQAAEGGAPPAQAHEEGLLENLFSAIQKALFDEEEGEKGLGESDEPELASHIEEQVGNPDQAGQGMQPASQADSDAKQIPDHGQTQAGTPQETTAQQSQSQDAPPSQEGEGASGEARISRGDGGGLLGQATTVLDQNDQSRSLVQLDVQNSIEEGEGDKESEQMVRPPRYNEIHTLKPEDVTVTPSDPFITQRVPSSYRSTIRKILTKP
jgi:hypothetical protein